MSETGLKLCQPPSPSDVPQPLSPAAQATPSCSHLAPNHPAGGLASGPVPQPACWRVLRVCDWPQAQPSQLATHSGPSVYDTGLAHPATRPSTAQPSPPIPSSRHNQRFAASWLRLASGPAQSLPSPGPAHLRARQPLPAPNSQPISRLSPVCQGQVCLAETGRRPTTSLTCLRLVSSYASCSAAQADQAFSAQSETGLKVCQPETSLRPSPSARLLVCLTCRLASGPA